MLIILSILVSALLVTTVIYRRSWLEEIQDRGEDATSYEHRIDNLNKRLEQLNIDFEAKDRSNDLILHEMNDFKAKLAKIKELIT